MTQERLSHFQKYVLLRLWAQNEEPRHLLPRNELLRRWYGKVIARRATERNTAQSSVSRSLRNLAEKGYIELLGVIIRPVLPEWHPITNTVKESLAQGNTEEQIRTDIVEKYGLEAVRQFDRLVRQRPEMITLQFEHRRRKAKWVVLTEEGKQKARDVKLQEMSGPLQREVGA